MKRWLLLDVGNTHTHLGLANEQRVRRQAQIPTATWLQGHPLKCLRAFLAGATVNGTAFCSVVPNVNAAVRQTLWRVWDHAGFELTAATVRGVKLDYPRPHTIGADRLANAVAARHHYGAPVVVIDFGTAVTFDVVDRRSCYVGGVIAPGLSAMTGYLHEKTALLPPIQIRNVHRAIGRSTVEAMRIGAVRGYRGLIRTLLREIQGELRCRRLPVVATGGYARLIASQMPEIIKVDPRLTLEGLRLVASAHGI